MKYRAKVAGPIRQNWCAKIVGLDAQYQYKRQWVYGTLINPSVDGSDATAIDYDMEDGAVYEISEDVGDGMVGRRCVAVVNGKMVDMTRDDEDAYAMGREAGAAGVPLDWVMRQRETVFEEGVLSGLPEDVARANRLRDGLRDKLEEIRDTMDQHVAPMTIPLAEKVRLIRSNESCCNRMIHNLDMCYDAGVLIALLGDIDVSRDSMDVLRGIQKAMEDAKPLADGGDLVPWAAKLVMDYYSE